MPQVKSQGKFVKLKIMKSRLRQACSYLFFLQGCSHPPTHPPRTQALEQSRWARPSSLFKRLSHERRGRELQAHSSANSLQQVRVKDRGLQHPAHTRLKVQRTHTLRKPRGHKGSLAQEPYQLLPTSANLTPEHANYEKISALRRVAFVLSGIV